MKIADIRKSVSYFRHVSFRQLPFFYKFHKGRYEGDAKIIGMIRERNEALLLKDTLDHLAQFVDAIIVFDDASDDESVKIALRHPKVIEVIVNKKWRRNRLWEETSNRKKLHDRAKTYKPQWLFYSDADERFEGDIRNFLLNECPADVGGINISLFDAYITPGDKKPYSKKSHLYNFRKYFGVERRDILMIWRNGVGADFTVPDAREPRNIKDHKIITKFYCQHYGKSLSIEHWEETCRYYVDHFPKYRDKWRARMGKAIHELSDFDKPLMKWDDVKLNSIDMKSI